MTTVSLEVNPRIVCSFSCGAASAVASKLAVEQFPDRDIQIVNIFVEEEHADNRRFLKDVETWLRRPITVICDYKYGASTLELFRKKRFIIGPRQAPCSQTLKKEVINNWYRPNDEVVIGYTKEELGRADRFIDANPDRVCHFPLIDAGLSKSDCLALIEKAGIELPAMYRLGFNNANCIGCVKGGQAYWNKIKQVFPNQFARMSELEERLGAGILRYRSGPRKGQRMPLKELQPTKHTINDEPDISCGPHCELIEVIYW